MISTPKIEPITTWTKSSSAPLLISGPCSAETPEQLLNTAEQLVKHTNISILRAGIWKPRTRPNAFEGVGEEGLTWLAETGKKLNLLTATEVATPHHVEQALKAGINILWIGARTATNPFSVQAIADTIKGTDVPVMVKNPINPDLNLWIGALERIMNAGITKIAAIHRGFSSYHEEYRNAPMWEIPLKLKTQFPDLPIINDPSHISGSREHLFDVAQKALNLAMDGLMIEAHIHPDKAWSDASQQITPQNLAALLKKLTVRTPSSPSVDYNTKLEELRSKIDRLDHELINTVAQRVNCINEIGDYKKENEVTIFQNERWREILETRLELGKKLGVSAPFLDKLLQVIHDESIKIQTERFKK